MNVPRTIPVGVFAVALLAFPGPVAAGPPMLCHPIEIGGAKSLPWGSGGGWNSPLSSYPLEQLVADTQALLSPDTPVLARMETLRRAAIYASRDVRVAADLLSTLSRRALERNAPKPDRHAWFDFGYLVETYKQADFLFKTGNPADGIDGYRHVKKAITMGTGVEPEMEFAAALIVQRREPGAATVHHRRAVAGATTDSLLARNLSARFP